MALCEHCAVAGFFPKQYNQLVLASLPAKPVLSHELSYQQHSQVLFVLRALRGPLTALQEGAEELPSYGWGLMAHLLWP